jgi:hypothetical protein
MTLKQLHAVIQAATEWEDAHLWEFTLGRERIGSSRAARMTLQDLLRSRVTKLGYTYDMGDCWSAFPPVSFLAHPPRRVPGAKAVSAEHLSVWRRKGDCRSG